MRKFSVLFLVIIFNSATVLATQDVKSLEILQRQKIAEEKNQNNSYTSGKHQNDYFKGEKIKELEEVFKGSPFKAQDIVEHLKNPKLYDDPAYRYSMFVGPPGGGKTNMAKAIAYMMVNQGWRAEVIECARISGKYRNEAAERLKEILDGHMASKAPIIFILDELNRLLENSNNEHFDTDTTSTFLWQFLDGQKGNHNFFLIGTMNRDTKLPQPFKNRIFSCRVEFPAPSPDEMVKRFKNKMANATMSLDKDVTDEFLKEFAKKLGPTLGRDLDELIRFIKIILRMSKQATTKQIIAKKMIEQAGEELLSTKVKMEYETLEETEAERQERHFLQKYLIDVLIHTCSKMKYHPIFLIPGTVDYTIQEIPEECNALIISIFNDQQAKMFEEIFSNVKKNYEHNKESIKKNKNRNW